MKSIVETAIVSAEQMRQIEAQIFAAGMPVAALMEKAARLCFDKIKSLYPLLHKFRKSLWFSDNR